VEYSNFTYYGPIEQGAGYQYRTVYFCGGPQYNPLPVVPPNPITDSEVALKLIKRAKGNQFATPVFLAEAGKTSSMVYQRAMSIVKLFVEVKKGNFRYFFDNLHVTVSLSKSKKRRLVRKWNKRYLQDSSKSAANAVLEYSYGWVPFMLEVRSAVNTLMDVVDRPENRVSRIAVKLERKLSPTVTLKDTWDFGIHGLYRINRTDVVTHSRNAVWRFTPSNLDLPARFGLVNLAEVVWELVPLSFVADWFFPIGDYLGALDVPYRFSHAGGTYGARTEVVSTYVLANPSVFSTAVFEGATGGATYRVSVSRTPMLTIPLPKLSEFSFQPELGTQRVMSAAALLRQAVDGLTRR